uniref:Uncharacterized protein n=1 Tax=Parascaris equorum TaxID=6256 RepID=A0A914S411_PAREQ
MKLYSILIFHKDSTGKVKAMKSVFDLTSFSFFQRSSVQEFMTFTGKLLVERSAVPSRSCVKENEYFCYTYVRPDGLACRGRRSSWLNFNASDEYIAVINKNGERLLVHWSS